MGRGAWRATLHGVAESLMQLSEKLVGPAQFQSAEDEGTSSSRTGSAGTPSPLPAPFLPPALNEDVAAVALPSPCTWR